MGEQEVRPCFDASPSAGKDRSSSKIGGSAAAQAQVSRGDPTVVDVGSASADNKNCVMISMYLSLHYNLRWAVSSAPTASLRISPTPQLMAHLNYSCRTITNTPSFRSPSLNTQSTLTS